MKIPFLHIHNWNQVLKIDRCNVRHCVTCDEYQSLLWDYQKRCYKWVQGCYYPVNAPIYIAAGDRIEFEQKRQASKAEGLQVQYLQLPYPTEEDGVNVFLTGTWYDNEDYWNDDFTRLLNRRSRL